MDIEEVLNKEDILMFQDYKNKEEVFENLSNHLFQEKKISNKEEFFEALENREKESFTGLTNGIAIPHGISDAVLKPTVVYAKLINPIAWECIDDVPVQDIFMLAIPQNDKSNIHIKMLSELARSLMEEGVIESLKKAKTADDILKIIKEGRGDL